MPPSYTLEEWRAGRNVYMEFEISGFCTEFELIHHYCLVDGDPMSSKKTFEVII